MTATSVHPPAFCPAAVLCSAHEKVQAIPSRIKPLARGYTLSGLAQTVRISPGQNGAIHRAIYKAAKGDVLVVDAGAGEEYGAFGEILALCCRKQGIAGLVIDGGVRDTREIREMGFPVFCRAITPRATKKTEAGDTGDTLHVGNAIIRPGDWIVGDDDGVVAIPKNHERAARRNAEALLKTEKEIVAKIESGIPSTAIFSIPGTE